MMNQYFINENGNYFVAITPIPTPSGSIVVPQRPAPHWQWDGAAWVEGVVPAPEPEPIPNLTFAQLLIGLVTEQWITEADGEAWLAGTLPATVLAVIESLPAEYRFSAKARAIRPSEVLRADPLVAMMAMAQGRTDVEIDDFFRKYAGV